MRSTPVRLAALVGALFAAAMILSGCGLLGAEKVSVSDPDNLFHFKIPASWQTSTEQGFLSVYAAEKLPAPDQQATALSVLVFTSSEPTATSEPDMLDYLIDTRAEQRGWKDVKKSTVVPAEVGGVKGYSMDVSATGADGATFDSRYYFVRTSGGEAFIVAVAPKGKAITDYDDELTGITTEWFWHTAGVGKESLEDTQTETKP